MIIFEKIGIDSLTAEEQQQLSALAEKAGAETHEERDFIAERLEALRQEEASNKRYREELEASFK